MTKVSRYPLVDTLMGPIRVIVINLLFDHTVNLLFVKGQGMAQAFSSQNAHESLALSIRSERLKGCLQPSHH